MMKLKYLIIMLLLTFILPTGVLADGNVSVSTSKLNITKGSSVSFRITANNSAGRVDISTSNSGVASISDSTLFLDMQSGTITVSGNSVGTATITVYVFDVTTYDDEDLSGKSYTINVTVSEPVNNNTNNNLSKNNNIKSLTVEGYDLVKVDNNNFTLSVSNNVTNVNIKALAEDSKATVTGDGLRELNIGENVIEVLVTSEYGEQNKYVLNITRKDGYYLEDLSSLLEDLTQNDINIKINADTIISSDILKKIKVSGKKVNLNYNDENNKLYYSWLIDGSMIVDIDEFLTSVSYISEYKKEISLLSNYADGLYINIKNNNRLPNGIMIKLYVGDKFEDGDKVRLYCYDNKNNNLMFMSDNINVNGKHIEFEVENCSNYFVTMSSIKSLESEISWLNIFVTVGMIITIIVCFIIIFILKIKANKKNDNNKNVNNDIIIDNNINENPELNNNESTKSVNNIDVEESHNDRENIKFDTYDVSSFVVDNSIVNDVNESINLNHNIIDNINNKENDIINNQKDDDYVIDNIVGDEINSQNDNDKTITFDSYNIDLKDNRDDTNYE